MNAPLPSLSDHEISMARPSGDEPGFGALNTERGLLPLTALSVETRIFGLIAETRVSQTFANPHGSPLEATYIFPLPDRSAVSSFSMKVADRVVDGVLEERGAARKKYDAAIQAGQRASIAEEERSGVFTLRVGNILPGERATVTMTLVGPIPIMDGEATFRFPLVVAPRYIPGTPMGDDVGDGVASDTDAVPDASRISPPVLLPGFPSRVRLSISAEIDSAGLTMGQVRSSLFAVTASQSGSTVRVEVRPGEKLDRDFILRWPVATSGLCSSLVTFPKEDGGIFMLTLVPPQPDVLRDRPRDVIFVLDRSGSMGGWKMVAARRAAARMIDALTDRDRFGVLAFDDRIDRPAHAGGQTLIPATDRNRFRAVEFLASLEARGGTEMLQPLVQAARALKNEQGRDRSIVLITDGQVGNEDQILRSLAPEMGETRFFALGVDRAVNAAFLTRLAQLGGGATDLVESEDRLDEVMAKIHRRIATALLSGISVQGSGGLEILQDTVAPERIPDAFAGAPVVVLGKYRGSSFGSVLVRGRDLALGPTTTEVRSNGTSVKAIASVYGRARIRDLEDRIASGRGQGLDREIVRVSLEHSVLSRFTAFVAVDREIAASGPVHRVVQPVESPSGWGVEVDALSAAAPVAKRARAAIKGGAAAPEPLMDLMESVAPAAAPTGGGAPFRLAQMAPEDDAPASFEVVSRRAAPAAPPPPPAPSRPMRAEDSSRQGLGSVMKAVISGIAGALDGGATRSEGGASKDRAAPAKAPAPMQAPAPVTVAAPKPGRSPVSADLSAYAKRALRIIEVSKLDLGATSDEELRRTLGRLASELEMMLEDLATTGNARPSSLDALVIEIRSVLGAFDRARGANLFQRALQELQSFADTLGVAQTSPQAPSGGSRRDSFWKT